MSAPFTPAIFSDVQADRQHHAVCQVADGTIYTSIGGVFYIDPQHANDLAACGFTRVQTGPPTALAYGAPITSSRALTAADFTSGLLLVIGNPTSPPVAVTVPTVSSLGLSASVGLSLVFKVAAGSVAPSFAGSTSGTTINGVAGPGLAPMAFALQPGGLYVLQQTGAAGSDAFVVTTDLGG